MTSSLSSNDAPPFHEFMLQQLEVNIQYSIAIEETSRQTEQFYLTAITVVVAGASLFLANPIGVKPPFIVGISLLLITLFGTQRTLRELIYFEAELSTRITRAGLIRYFRDLSPKDFEKYGSQIALNRLETPYHWLKFGRDPWRQAKLIGFFATTHGVLLGLSLGMLAGTLLELTYLANQSSVIFLVSALIGAFAFLAYIYWMAGKTRFKHERVRDLYEHLYRSFEIKHEHD